MIYHLVLFKFDSNAASKKKIDELYTALKTLVDIPGVLLIDFGPAEQSPYAGYLLRNRDYTHGLVVVLQDRAALEGYEHSSIHTLVRTSFIRPLLDTTQPDPVLAFDFEGHFDKKPGFFDQFIPEWNLKNTFIATTITVGVASIAGYFIRRKLGSW